jgi:chromosome segregation ATPase
MEAPNLAAGGPQPMAPTNLTQPFNQRQPVTGGGGMSPAPSQQQRQMMMQMQTPHQGGPKGGPGGGMSQAAGNHQYSNSPAINNTSNMYSQLETMMNAVKKEAKSLEAVKQKIREMDGLRSTVNELRSKLQQTEGKNNELLDNLKVNDGVIEGLRADMQRLNDIYTQEREEYQDSQQLNLSLQQEIANIKNEVQFYQKEAAKMPELRKKNAGMVTQIGALGKQQEEEKAIFAKTIQSLEEKLSLAGQEKEKSSEHFWNLSEEVKTLKKTIADNENNNAGSNKLVWEATEARKTAEERTNMIAEDQLTFFTREREGIDEVRAELEGAQGEIRGLRSLIDDKEEEQLTLHAKLRNIEEARVSEKAEVRGRMATLKENVSHLKSKNHELERENSEAQHRLGLIGGDVSRYTMEVEHLQAELSRSEVKQKQQDAEWQRKLDESVRLKDDAIEKLGKATTNFEAMQNQARDSQSRYWEELQRVKEAESQLTEEAERLATELEEKTAKLVVFEAEKAKMEEYMRGEVSGAMEMTNALRGELERRLDELTSMRKERDESVEDREKMEAQVNEMKAIMNRQEQTFQRTLDNDRNKISGEIKAKMNKLRGLEVEKQELLMETSNLMKQVENTQRTLNQTKTDLEQKSREAKEASMKVEEMQDEAVSMQKRLKTHEQTEIELRAHADRLESSFKEDIARLDNLVKESKKAAAHQVLEIQDRVKVANEELDMMRVRVKDAQEHEQKGIAEAEKSKTELEIASKSHEDMQQQMAKDMTTLRRELQDMRNKQKIHSESRTKMEMETMNARLEATKAENEANKAIEWAKEVEHKLENSQEEARKYKKESHEHEREFKKTQLKRVEAEEAVAKKNAAIERLTKDMAKLEREGLVEVRRMRVSLQAAEQEVAEVKPLIPLLQKELADTKSAHERTQTSTNETVNGLLEELRNTEDALSAERKKNGNDAEQYRYKLNTMTAELEKAKEHIESHMVSGRKQDADKDMRVLQLQQELEHIKELVIKKEARMEELEKQRQSDRNRIVELRTNLETAERSIMDGKTTLELEQAQRKRLETRLKTAASSTVDHTPQKGRFNHDDDGSRSGGGDDEHIPSTTEKRTKMLYGDHSDAAEPAYDDMDESYGGDGGNGTGMLDAASALSAIGVGGDHNENSGSPNGAGDRAAAATARRKQQMMASGIAGDDDDFMAERANPPMTAFLSNSASAPALQPSSPRGKVVDNSGSPAIDKVQAAIDARASANGAKASLKAQSQLRQQERRMRMEEERGGSGGSDGGDGGAGGGNRKGHVDTVRERVESASTMNITGSGGGGNAAGVEDSIERTQMFLRQRLAQRAKAGGGGAADPDADARLAAAAYATGNGGGDDRDGAIAAQELAAQAYERQRAANRKTGGGAAAGDEPGTPGYNLGAPTLSPARPVNSINGMNRFSPSPGR